MLSISSIKITAGALSAAKANKHFMSFSPSPIHLLVNVEAEQLKNVDLHSVAIAFASIVFPLPGGPYSKIPLEGESSPLKISGFKIGSTMVSLRVCFTSAKPLISSQFTLGEWSKIVSSIDRTISGSKLDFGLIVGATATTGTTSGLATGFKLLTGLS